MKIYSKKLLDAISKLITVNNPVLPIIENYLFKIENNVLSITTTDLENTTISNIEVFESVNGSWCVPFKLKEVLNSLKDSELEFIFDEVLTIKTTQGKYQLPLFDASEFPKTISFDGEFTNVGDDFIQALDKTLFATGNDELRPIMTGISVRDNEVCSTDAHKLSKYVLKEKIGEFIIPKKACNIIRTLDNISIKLNDVNIEVKADDFTLVSRLINGKFPNYNAVIPNDTPITFTTDRIEFIKTIKRIFLFSNKTTNQIELHLSNKSTIKSSDVDHNQKAVERLNGNLIGEDITIGFNAKMLLEILNNLDEKEVTLNLIAPNRAMTITENNMLNLIMPVMLGK